MHSIERWHFQIDPNPDFKITTFFEVEYQKNSASWRQSYYCTRRKIPNIWNGTMFGDLDWPLSASRGFVSISWASCFVITCILTMLALFSSLYRLLCFRNCHIYITLLLLLLLIVEVVVVVVNVLLMANISL